MGETRLRDALELPPLQGGDYLYSDVVLGIVWSILPYLTDPVP
jgi:hypothetical protein